MIFLPSPIVLKYRLIKKRNELLGHPVIKYILIHVISTVFWGPNGRRLSRETPPAARRERKQLCVQARRGAREDVKLDSYVPQHNNYIQKYSVFNIKPLNAVAYCIVVYIQPFPGWSDMKNIILR